MSKYLIDVLMDGVVHSFKHRTLSSMSTTISSIAGIPRRRQRHGHPREDVGEDVGVGVEECQLIASIYMYSTGGGRWAYGRGARRCPLVVYSPLSVGWRGGATVGRGLFIAGSTPEFTRLVCVLKAQNTIVMRILIITVTPLARSQNECQIDHLPSTHLRNLQIW